MLCPNKPFEALSKLFTFGAPLSLLLFPLSFATKQNYTVTYDYFSMRQLNMNNIFEHFPYVRHYTHILSRNSRHKSTSWVLCLSTPYIWETGSHRWSNLVEILELEGSAMSLKLRSVSMLLTTALCCLTLSMLICVNTVPDQRKD